VWGDGVCASWCGDQMVFLSRGGQVRANKVKSRHAGRGVVVTNKKSKLGFSCSLATKGRVACHKAVKV
jgi:hypothetical protein